MIENTNGNGAKGAETVSDTVPLQTKKRRSPAEHLRPYWFVKGDPRINHKGRPKSFDEFRKLVQSVLSETIVDKDGKKMTAAEAMVRHAARSKDPALHRLAFEYAFGKVPDKIETTGLENKVQLILHYAHERNEALADAPAVNGEAHSTRQPLLRDAE